MGRRTVDAITGGITAFTIYLTSLFASKLERVVDGFGQFFPKFFFLYINFYFNFRTPLGFLGLEFRTRQR